MSAASAKAKQVAVEPDPLVVGSPDYADAFEIAVDPDDPRSAEDFARDALTGAPPLVYWTIYLAHRFVVRFDLGPRRSPAHIIGWTVTHRDPDAVRLETDGPIARGVIVGRRPEPTRTMVTTSVFFKIRPLARTLMPLVGPVHRVIAKQLLQRAVALEPSDADPEVPRSAAARPAFERR